MLDLNSEIKEFKQAWISADGHFKFVDYNPKFGKFELTGFTGTLSDDELMSTLCAVNASWGMWLKAKQAKTDGVVIKAADIETAITSGPDKVKQLTEHLENVVAEKAIELCNGNLIKASDLTGIYRTTLSKRHKRFIQSRAS
ncbi:MULTISPECIES: hypothetical protein [Acinetobacter]|uniref:DNA binding HTH domain-containing protein n=1 Tax=Acinetobacter higginsii TaxID=70347 RepID=N8XKD7_9GAMM|nr:MULTISPECIES: hypothetical protein [Acinetobacter]ENV09504.1 hypothetical protein F966_02162 [Acinetobacter higginsii]MCH7338163.1 helix-turn-helix domain-containing protein [Acinetobacter higginsii]